MARWRLINAHYLNVLDLSDGTRIEWEHKETSRENGRTIRKLYPVPMLLDPKDAADCNYPGEIIVAREDSEHLRNDILFLGDPTPEMEPLDSEAEAISAALRSKWEHPINSLPANGGMNSEEQSFMAKMMEAFARGAPTTNNVAVPSTEVADLKDRLAKLEALLASQQSKPESTPVRRV